MNIGETIRQERKKKRLSQKKLAALTSLTYPTILNIEANRGVMLNNLLKVCKAIDLEVVIKPKESIEQ